MHCVDRLYLTTSLQGGGEDASAAIAARRVRQLREIDFKDTFLSARHLVQV
jgi:hypothetical protein